MKQKKWFVFAVIFIFVIVTYWFFAGQPADNATYKNIGSVTDFSTNGLTLVERMQEDIDLDDNKEHVEVYVSAQIASDGQMGWDTDHQWVLLVRQGEVVFPLIDDHLHSGELQFWIAASNQNPIEGSESTELQMQIYATVTTNVGFKVLRYTWDAEKDCYKEEVVLETSNPWFMRHSNKYNIFDPGKIE